MVYQEIVRQLKLGRFFKLLFGIPAFAAFSYAGYTIGQYTETGIKTTVICTAVPAVLGLLFVVKQFTMGAKLKKMQRTVGVASDSEMNEILEKALMLRERYFFTHDYALNFNTLRAYPLKNVTKVTPYGTCDDEGHMSGYGLKIKVQGYPNDSMMFDSGSECIQAREELEG